MIIMGINYEEAKGQDTYESVRVHVMDTESESVFGTGDVVQDWNDAIDFAREKLEDTEDLLIMGSSTIDDFLVEDPMNYLIDEETGYMKVVNNEG